MRINNGDVGHWLARVMHEAACNRLHRVASRLHFCSPDASSFVFQTTHGVVAHRQHLSRAGTRAGKPAV